MSNRILRVNELIQRELSHILRQQYQVESAAITIAGVQVSPDLHEGVVYVSVFGPETVAQEKLKWLRKNQQELRFELGRTIVLKHMPKFVFKLDETTERGNRILGILDSLDTPKATEAKAEAAKPNDPEAKK